MHLIRVVSHPPLKQLTVIPESHQEVPIVAQVITTNAAELDTTSFEIHICHVDAGSAQHAPCWPSMKLVECERHPVRLQQHEDGHARHTRSFSGIFYRPRSTETHQLHRAFTFKYRNSDQEDWHWIHGSGGLDQGELIFRSWSPGKPLHLGFELHPDWENETVETGSPKTQLFCTQSRESVGPLDSSGGLNQRRLGRVRAHSRYLAFSRIGPPWMGPRHGDYFFRLNEDAMVVSFLTKEGGVITIAAPCLDDKCQVIRSDCDGGIVIAARADADPNQCFRVFISMACDIEPSLDAIMTYLRQEAAHSDLSRRISDATSDLPPHRSNITSEDWLDGLSFCTWNSIGQELTQDKILKALRELRGNNIPISSLLIDDNWQTLGPTLHDFSNPFFRGLVDFRADQTAFPEGLSGLVRAIRFENPLIQHIGVWHALMGYWGGLAEHQQEDKPIGPTNTSTPIRKAYQTTLIPSATLFSPSFQPLPDLPLRTVSEADLPRFYDDFYSYLASSGIAFVKTDVQSLLSGLGGGGSERATFIPAYQAAQTAAGIRHFYPGGRRGGGGVITCMALTPELMWNSLLKKKKNNDNETTAASTTTVLRNSDDFFPDAPPSAHPWHVWANAHNALLTSASSENKNTEVVLDWDMFQSGQDRFGPYHAAARCLSGGPLTMTDVPGREDRDLLVGKILAACPSGGGGDERKMMVLRPAVPGKTTRAFDGYKESGVLRIATRNGAGKRGGRAKIMGFFNVLGEEEKEDDERGEAAGVSFLVGAGEMMVDSDDEKWEDKEDDDDEGIISKREVVVFSYNTQRTYGPFTVVDGRGKGGKGGSLFGGAADSMIAIDLPMNGFEILNGYEVLSVAEPARHSHEMNTPVLRYCVLGLLGKMTGAAAILSVEGWVEQKQEQGEGQEELQKQTHIRVCSKALGMLGVWMSGNDIGTKKKKDSIKVLLEGEPVDDGMIELVALDGLEDARPEGAGGGCPFLMKVDILGMWARAGRWNKGNRREVLVDIVL